MKVSIIVPVYKAEEYIAQCVRSLLAQTYKDLELLFVDDGCPDRTVEMLEDLLKAAPERDARVIHQENSGPSQARLTGLQQASGDYVLFADADDWLEPDMVESLVDAVQDSGADMAYCQIINETEKGSYVSRDPHFTSCRDAAKAILRLEMHGYVWNKLIRRSLFTPDIHYPRLSMHEDLVLLCQVLYFAGSCVMVPRPLYHYRRTSASSLSQKGKRERDAISARVFLQLFDFWKDRIEGSPLEGQVPYILVRCAWLAYKNDRSIFAEYPYLADEAAKVPVSCRLPVKLHRQLILKRALRRGL